jgi:biotin carboxyl carrier protein
MSIEHWLYKITSLHQKVKGLPITQSELDQLDVQKLNHKLYHVLHQNQSYTIEVEEVDIISKKIIIRVNGILHYLQVKDRLDVLIEEMGLDKSSRQVLTDVHAPMPGMVISVDVKTGQSVSKGDTMLVLEAMKMENTIKAPGDAIIKSILIEEGGAVDKGQLLITFE